MQFNTPEQTYPGFEPVRSHLEPGPEQLAQYLHDMRRREQLERKYAQQNAAHDRDRSLSVTRPDRDDPLIAERRRRELALSRRVAEHCAHFVLAGSDISAGVSSDNGLRSSPGTLLAPWSNCMGESDSAGSISSANSMSSEALDRAL